MSTVFLFLLSFILFEKLLLLKKERISECCAHLCTKIWHTLLNLINIFNTLQISLHVYLYVHPRVWGTPPRSSPIPISLNTALGLPPMYPSPSNSTGEFGDRRPSVHFLLLQVEGQFSIHSISQLLTFLNITNDPKLCVTYTKYIIGWIKIKIKDIVITQKLNTFKINDICLHI